MLNPAKDFCGNETADRLCGDKGNNIGRTDSRETVGKRAASVTAGLAKDVEAVNRMIPFG